MKTFFTAALVVVAMLSLSGCESIGKGKAPIPVITNG